jgi:hypothetical protein
MKIDMEAAFGVPGHTAGFGTARNWLRYDFSTISALNTLDAANFRQRPKTGLPGSSQSHHVCPTPPTPILYECHVQSV